MKNFFTNIGYSVSLADEAIFYKIEGEKFTIVAAATDDFSIIADSTDSTNLLIQKQLRECFEILDLGPINWLLGISITRDFATHTISLGQQAYVEQYSTDLVSQMLVLLPHRWKLDLISVSTHLRSQPFRSHLLRRRNIGR